LPKLTVPTSLGVDFIIILRAAFAPLDLHCSYWHMDGIERKAEKLGITSS